MFSTQTVGIAIAGVATASFATGFIGAEQALKQQVELEVAQPLQPNFYSTSQSILWYSDNGLNHVNRQVQLARQQSELESESAIGQSPYFDSDRHTGPQTETYESYANESSWSIFDRDTESSPARSVSPAQNPLDPTNEAAASAVNPYRGTAGDTLPETSTEQAERYYPTESSEPTTHSTDHRSDYESAPRSLKPNFVWQSSPDFVKDYIKAGAK